MLWMRALSCSIRSRLVDDVHIVPLRRAGQFQFQPICAYARRERARKRDACGLVWRARFSVLGSLDFVVRLRALKEIWRVRAMIVGRPRTIRGRGVAMVVVIDHLGGTDFTATT